MGLLDLQALIGLGHAGTLGVNLFLRLRMRVFSQWQTLLLSGQAHLALFGTFIGERRQLLPAFAVGIKLFKLILPMDLVVRKLGQAGFILVLRFAAVANLGFQSRHLGIGRK